MSNNYVAIATKMCPVCGEMHTNNGELLIHKNLGNIDPDKTCTGYGLCEEDQKKFDEGYIALIETSTKPNSDVIQMEDAVRTGVVIHMKREMFERFYNTEVPADLEMVFIEPEVTKIIEGFMVE